MGEIEGLNPVDRQAVNDFSRQVRESMGEKIVFLRVFGSKVRGTDSADSDIDIFVVVSDESYLTKRAIIDTAFDVNLKYDVYISPRVVPQRLFEHSAFHATPFIRRIEEQGVPL